MLRGAIRHKEVGSLVASLWRPSKGPSFKLSLCLESAGLAVVADLWRAYGGRWLQLVISTRVAFDKMYDGALN